MILLKELSNDLNDKRLYNRVVKNFRRCYSGIMPKKYWIFPQQPNIYIMSKSICIEFPAWGSREYRYELSDLQKKLYKNFIMETYHSDGIITFVLKKAIT